MLFRTVRLIRRERKAKPPDASGTRKLVIHSGERYAESLHRSSGLIVADAAALLLGTVIKPQENPGQVLCRVPQSETQNRRVDAGLDGSRRHSCPSRDLGKGRTQTTCAAHAASGYAAA